MRLQSLNQMQLGQPWPCCPPAVVIGSKGVTPWESKHQRALFLLWLNSGQIPVQNNPSWKGPTGITESLLGGRARVCSGS